jgi:hypothetical protein
MCPPAVPAGKHRSGQAAILGSPRKGIDNVEHGGSLLQVIGLFDDLGLLLGDLELPGESVDGAFGIIDMAFQQKCGNDHVPVETG